MIVAISLIAGILFYYLLTWLMTSILEKRIVVQARLTELTGGSKDTREIEGDLRERIFEPLLNRAGNFFALMIPVDDTRTQNLNNQLTQAGISLRGQQYRAAVVLVTLALAVLLLFYGFLSGQSIGMNILLVLLGIYGGVVMSRFHLQSKITQRKKSISRQFPSVMDLLSVCVTAGLGFDQSVLYIVQRMEGELIEELKSLLREISLGTPRHEALTRFSKRCGTQEIEVFVSALNQAEELGSPLANILESQAKAVRHNHKRRTEEEAQKVAVKMILPMVLFILPVVFIIILGPIVPSVIDGLGGL